MMMLNEQAFIEGRITLEKTLRNAKLISDEDLERYCSCRTLCNP